MAASLPEDCRQCYIENWCQIRSRQRDGKLLKVYTQRLEKDSDIGAMLDAIFRAQRNAFKINMSFGFILSNVETGEIRYYYPSQNGFIFDQPLVVADEDDLQSVLQHVGEVDWLEYVRQQKPNSKWRIALLTNVAFHVYPLVDRSVGRGEKGKLPKWLIENRGLDALDKDNRTGKLYTDNLCYFRCLARYQGWGLKNLEGKTKELASRYFTTLEHGESFEGVHLSDLHALDTLFDIHTFVYSLGEDRKVELVHRPTVILSHQQSQEALRLNLYDDHFSYINHLAKYSQCYTCNRCDASFPKAYRLHRHEQSCEAKVKRVYPGGVFHPSKTIFEKIEEDIFVAQELKYSQYRATFDIEVYYPREGTNLRKKREKLEYTAEHQLLSISVASNVPGHEEAKCFVVEGEGREQARQTVVTFVENLEKIAEKASQLELQCFTPLLNRIEETLGTVSQQPPSRVSEEHED